MITITLLTLILSVNIEFSNSQMCFTSGDDFIVKTYLDLEHTIVSSKYNIYEDSHYQYFDEFINFIDTYNKHYSTSTEFWYRYSMFSQNMDKIYSHNLNGTNTYQLGINKFADMSHKEFNQIFLSKKYSDFRQSRIEMGDFNEVCNDELPESVDWRASNLVTNIKDQKQCGSCWAFSAVGAMEGQHAKATGNLVSLSEQDLVDCVNSTKYNCYGCEGGYPYNAMQYVIDAKGIDGESGYPYKGLDGTCVYNSSQSLANISKVVNVTQGSMESLYNAIGTIGPISIAIDAEDKFQFYKSGIFTDTECSKDMLDHAVLAVGYGKMDNNSYIIVKNSWGTDWGMDGYIYMSTDIPNMCGMAQMASYPLVD